MQMKEFELKMMAKFGEVPSLNRTADHDINATNESNEANYDKFDENDGGLNHRRLLDNMKEKLSKIRLNQDHQTSPPKQNSAGEIVKENMEIELQDYDL